MSTTPEIDAINETIAIFDRWTKRNAREFTKGGCLRYVWEFRYHESWDELMPVIERIETPDVISGLVPRAAADVAIFYTACIIKYEPDEESGDENEEAIIQTNGETKLNAAYKAVYQFIALLNNKKQATC